MTVEAVAFAWFDRPNYEKLLQLADDRSNLYDDHREWLAAANKGVDKLRAAGKDVLIVQVDTDKLKAWCDMRGKKLDAQARIQYALAIAAENDANAKR